ncbi:hypothetical protein SARC_01100 [Sphaeroforma arctica JP610]|uniref:Uncharacterized protein n=1 Tax=Sphaeroforma arctica JP610 TaxID=667725 RepID=A0A0L0GD00_9EUKA|nr:hypothetical protein SARC_01100 [Sphaeroforma arctica JP610]KNC86766.1 hypothetical protein SARC_01100 [Sphaeroforma arctica JP610]|eukprot:XP_014160668.1 hypothetical protein SARC_01100 [Sphaeroforma arctica JP610]
MYSHETQATVDPAFCNLAKGHNKLAHVPVIEQMTRLMENHSRAREPYQTDADFQQSILNHCVVQLLEEMLDARTYERTLKQHPKSHLMATHELLQLMSLDIQEAQQRSTARSLGRQQHHIGNTTRGYTNSCPNPQTAQRQN